MAELLVDAGADVNAPDQNLLIEAVKKKDTRFLELLLCRGARVDSTTRQCDTCFVGDENTALMFAASQGNMEAVKMLLEAGAKANKTNIHGRTALMFAYSVSTM